MLDGVRRKTACWILIAGMTIFMILLLATCAPKGQESDTAVKKNAPDVTIDWSIDVDCSTCHTAEQASYSNQQSEAAQHEDVTCIHCHSDVVDLEKSHQGKTSADALPNRLKSTQVPDSLCLGCHYENRAALITATDSTAIVSDSEGTSRNPHDTEGLVEHESLKCRDCHKMHSTEDINKTAMNQCTSCHHEGVFQCYTCHE